VHPLDPDLDLPWPSDVEALLSDKDAAAPSLAEAQAGGLLPDFAQCEGFYASLRGGGPSPTAASSAAAPRQHVRLTAGPALPRDGRVVAGDLPAARHRRHGALDDEQLGTGPRPGDDQVTGSHPRAGAYEQAVPRRSVGSIDGPSTSTARKRSSSSGRAHRVRDCRRG
jgi:hypothetical protein